MTLTDEVLDGLGANVRLAEKLHAPLMHVEPSAIAALLSEVLAARSGPQPLAQRVTMAVDTTINDQRQAVGLMARIQDRDGDEVRIRESGDTMFLEVLSRHCDPIAALDEKAVEHLRDMCSAFLQRVASGKPSTGAR